MYIPRKGEIHLPRTGRPPKQETPRGQCLSLRLTAQEKEEIQSCADALHMSRTDTIMYCIRQINSQLEKEQ